MLNQPVFSSGRANLQTVFPEVINSRFGEVSVDLSRCISFTRGLLGMPDKLNFIITGFSSKKMEQFKLLQSLDDANLSFITLPIDMNNNFISAADIRGAADDLGIDYEDLGLLLIVSVHRSPDNVRLSVNVRAPLFLDVKHKTGTQYVFRNDIYKVQHML